MKNILLAGANGFIGTFLYGKLKSKYSLAGLDYSTESNLEEYFSANLTDMSKVQSFCDESPHYDALIFLVGLAHKKGKGKEINEFRSINKQTLVNLLTSLKEKNKLPSKIIFASTISVYGEQMGQTIYDESSTCTPKSPYAQTKLEAENFLLSNFPNQSWILRFASVYSDSFKLNIQRRTKMKGFFYKVGDGQTKLSLCHLENIYLAISGILDEKVPSGVYNISDSDEYTYNELLKVAKANWIFSIPKTFAKLFYIFGKLTNNIFLKENSVKLLSDNVFPSNKIRNYINLPWGLNTLSTNEKEQK